MHLTPTESRLVDILVVPGAHPARDVAAAIWPASDPEDMLYELRVYVSRLRLIGYTICNEPIAGTRRFAGYRLLALPFGRRSVETN